MNTLGLAICLIGITIHVLIKGKEKANAIKGNTNKTPESRFQKKKHFLRKLCLTF